MHAEGQPRKLDWSLLYMGLWGLTASAQQHG